MRNPVYFEVEPFSRYGELEFESEMFNPPLMEQVEESEVNRSSPDYIRWVQQSLNQILGLRLAVDGIVGPMTRSAIRSFQGKYRLAVDGIVGPQTEAAIKAALSGRAPSQPSAGTPYVPAPSSFASRLKASIVQVALGELARWGFGTKREDDPTMRPILEEYWRVGVGYVPPDLPSAAWSAAFISYVMKKAGASNLFKYDSWHTTYVAAAKQNRLANNSNPFKAYRRLEVVPQIGDLVCFERASSGVTYDNVDQGGPRPSHSDIVTEVRAGKIIIVGGNVSQSGGDPNLGLTVRSREKMIDPNGFVTDPLCYAIVHIA